PGRHAGVSGCPAHDQHERAASTAARDALADVAADDQEGVVDRVDLAAAALSNVVATASAAAERLRGDADEIAGGQAPLTTLVVDRDDDDRSTVSCGRRRDDRRLVGGDSTSDVERELAQIVGGGPVG